MDKGMKVYLEIGYVANSGITINVSQLNAGHYIILLQQGNVLITKKFIVE
jgi:hypothetical protein